jgi:hypothetical protein
MVPTVAEGDGAPLPLAALAGARGANPNPQYLSSQPIPRHSKNIMETLDLTFHRVQNGPMFRKVLQMIL